MANHQNNQNNAQMEYQQAKILSPQVHLKAPITHEKKQGTI